MTKQLLFVLLSSIVAAPLHAEIVEVTNAASNGPGSLKAAIETANADPTPSEIRFNLPIGGTDNPATLILQLSVPLPEITTPVTIDGSTQPASVRVLLSNLTPFPTIELTTGSGGSTLKFLDIRGRGIEIKAPNVTIDDCDFAAVSGLGIMLGNHDDIGEPVNGLLIKNSRFTNADTVADTVLNFITLRNNTFTRSRPVATIGLGGQAMLDSTFENNVVECIDDVPYTALQIKHPIRNVFRGNSFKNCPGSIFLWSQTGSDSVGYNLLEANVFQGGQMSIGISGRKHSHNKITRNLSTGNTDEPIKLNGLLVADYGSELKPNHGKGRPGITNAYLTGPFFNRKVSMTGTTFVTPGTATDTVEIFVTAPGYTYTQATDLLVLSPKRYLTSVTASNGVWSALLDVGNFNLAGATSFSVTATDSDNNTSEFAFPYTIWISGF